MKKLIVMVSIVAIALGVLPIRVDAAQYSNTTDMGTKHGQMYIEWDYASDADKTAGIKTWQFYYIPNSNKKVVYMGLRPNKSAITIESVTLGSSFTKESEAQTDVGPNYLLRANSSSGLTAGQRVLMFTIKTKDIAKEGCYLNPEPLNLNCSTNIDNLYFDNEGNEITKDEYDKVCSNNPSDPTNPGDDVPNSPQTGSVIPYIAVGGGLIAVLGVYLFSRKSNKVYKL